MPTPSSIPRWSTPRTTSTSSWDWWGYGSGDAARPDYCSQQAIQIRAIHGLLQQAAGHLATGQVSPWLKFAAALPALALDAEAARQDHALAGAVAQQWLSLQAQWLDGLTELAQQMGQVRKVNTVSKFVDQAFDLAQQVFTLLSNQATASARLAENFQLDLAWWLTQRADVAKAT